MEFLESFESIFKSAFFERLVHGKIRQGFITGWIVMISSTFMLIIWVALHSDLQSCLTQSGVMFCVGIGLIGNLIQTSTDVADQEAGRFSKFGSGWDLWGDNIISNKINQFILFAAIVLSFGISAFLYLHSLQPETEATKQKVTTKRAVRNTAQPTLRDHHSVHNNSANHHHKTPVS